MTRARRTASARARRIDVLVVCTGNLCRSPIIATMLSYALPGQVIRSAGTNAPIGQPWHPLAIESLADAGYHVKGKAHQVRKPHVRDAKLILTAEGAHRGFVVGLDEWAADRTYTLLEAARLLADVPARSGIGSSALALHLALALRMRPNEFDDDLADPLLGTIDDFRHCLRVARSAVEQLLPALRD
ncbi:MAG: low molecular weight protein-tyrosine phosphatase [Pseudonocardiales bacterium]|nr:low molecular weight protein-tyrosine phosphatase [Pseudonocardiales bacterium]